jgi:four helix bundle protein
MSTQPSTTTATPRRPCSAVERLDCYRLAIELSRLATTLVPRGHAALRDQLERASASVALNLSEGWGRWQPREKAHFYQIALGSTLESVAVIDLLLARGLASESACAFAKGIAERVARMLGGLIRSVGARMR